MTESQKSGANKLLKHCPSCKSEQIITESGNCTVCSTTLNNTSNSSSAEPEDSDQLDIVVTEVPSDDIEFVGVDKHDVSDPKDKSNSSNEKRNSNEDTENSEHFNNSLEYDPIGISEPTLPPTPDYSDESKTEANQDPAPEPKPVAKASKKDEKPKEQTSGKLQKLSEDELKKVEQNLYGKNVHLADKEKASIRSKLNELDGVANSPEAKSNDSGQIEKPVLEGFTEPPKSVRSKGKAFFYKNYIQLIGRHHLTRHDELVVNGREYHLQPKKLNSALLFSSIAGAFIITLFVIGSMFLSSAGDGTGTVAGMIFSKSGKPYITGAEVVFPELGIRAKSNAQGYFNTSGIPEGTHKVDYYVKDKLIGSDFATIVDNEISMISLKPNVESKKSGRVAKKSSSKSATSKQVAKKTPTAKQSSPVTKSSNKATKTSTRRGPASVKLAANVDNARIKLDGKILGAGNLKYRNIEPGSHKYEISADGYSTRTGTVVLKSGETRNLAVSLQPLSNQVKETTYGAEDFFQSGLNAFKSGNFENAIADFTEAINLEPSYPQAYFNRAITHQQLYLPEEAVSDFIKAAEIYRFKKRSNKAITSYNKAIEIDNSSIPAYLGRAGIYLAKGEEVASLADYDNVLRLDKRSFRAYFGLGNARFNQGNFKQAIEHFKNARSINKSDPYVYQYLMLSYMAVDKFNDVKKSYNQFQEVASENQMREMLKDRKFTAAIQAAETQ